ncbi:MAG: hypothetical protein V7641_3961 [Blastocatellia bacterium]
MNIEDSQRDADLLHRHLTRAGYDVFSDRVETPAAMRAALEREPWDVILCDYSMPQFNALRALALLKEIGLDIPFIIISGTVGEAVAVEAMRAGAHDYLMKDNLVRLVPTIEREIFEAENRRARRQVEAALRESEDRYRDLVEHSHDLICTHDLEGQLLSVNQAAARILGYDPETLLGRNIREALLPAHHVRFDDYIAELLNQGFAQGVMTVQTRSGEKRIWEYSNTLRTEGVMVPLVRGLARDVTEQKRAEAALRESEAQYRRLLETTYEGVWVFDAAQRTTYVNQRLAEMLGVSAEEMIGRPAADFLDDAARADVEQRWQQRTQGIKEQYDLRLRRKDGADVWVIVCATPIFNERGEFIGSLSMQTDITNRKRIEEELKKSEERYRDLIENAHDIIYTHDLKGNYISVNKAVEQILGYTPEESLRMNLIQTVAPEYVETARQMVAKKLAGEKVTAYYLEIMAKNGRRIAVEVNTRLIHQDGTPVGVMGIARDVTERKQLEEQLRQSQKMEAIGQLAGGIAHDFNNLLTAIIGYSDLTLKPLKTEDPLRHYVGEIKKAGERAASLTRQLLAFSRKQVLQPKVLDLNEVVADLEKMLQRLIGEDIELRTVLDPKLGNIKADPGQIEQVIMNLAVNARDAMPQGGKLTIETANVAFDEEYVVRHIAVTPGAYIMLAVSDNGTGMDAETQARIFEPFFTTKEVGKGTGLGLSTVYGIIKQSGGHIWVYSEPGRGTTFKIYLTRVGEDAQEYKQVDEQAEKLRGTETILLAEDEEIVRELTREVLEMYGYRVLETPNGGAALLLCERYEGPIDLLITDVIMPEMSGRELANRLAQLRPEMAALYMSGYTDDAIVHHGILESDIAFLQKPFTPNALARKVREILDTVHPIE